MKTSTARTPRLAGLLCLLATGCLEPAQDLERGNADLIVPNGRPVNGNGPYLAGRTLYAPSFSGTLSSGDGLQSIWLQGSQFVGRRPNGTTVSGTAMRGAEITGRLDNSEPVRLRLDVVERSASDPEIWKYTISVFADGGWHDVCAAPDAPRVRATPLAVRWDYRSGFPATDDDAGGGAAYYEDGAITLACENGAIGECTDMGYKDWQSRWDWSAGRFVPLRGHHEACVRMLRADYCGDGMAHTITGTRINVWDRMVPPVQAKAATTPTSYYFEAEWTRGGAECVSTVRWNSVAEAYCADNGISRNDCTMTVGEYIQTFCPEKWSGPEENTSCGRPEAVSLGTLTLDEAPRER